MKAGVVGIGLIGGSIVKDLRHVGSISKIYGTDLNPEHCKEALELGLVDEITSLTEMIKKTDLIIISIPVDAARNVVVEVLDQINDHQVVTDVGSTKSGICKAVSVHKNRGRFVAGHPIAGTENSGPTAAIENLFLNKTGIICNREETDDDALEMIEGLYQALGMNIKYMEADEHDKHIAYVSHLSHISSFALALTVLRIEESEENIFDMAGSGFSSTVRLAKSSPDMWKPIFQHNSEYLERALDGYIDQLHDFKTFIKHNKTEDIHQLMAKANDIRRILDGKVKD
ncbi:Prephenate and/or arogenate dehydrogenase [Fulvivirga imtechensis AK7]|uniref:Prephenate and/or arogenate dehydrogenase n=1 Tax=Fulvivirga imtechensis AK7 TaxID=1237149 RepID=L8JLF4_9BACT|nr:prephenate dehydrogenase [Fulvivirga imtechensis]ELR69645.1 Prephenate and/or arogenate dehydrogenase [Fulvivirga imtechensis AK7]